MANVRPARDKQPGDGVSPVPRRQHEGSPPVLLCGVDVCPVSEQSPDLHEITRFRRPPEIPIVGRAAEERQQCGPI